MVTEESVFKGHPVLTLKKDENSQFGFSFGVGKAKLILDHLDEIRAFVEEHDTEEGSA